MTDSLMRMMWPVGTKPSKGRESRLNHDGSTRPERRGDDTISRGTGTGECLIHLTRERDQLVVELHALALDHDQARLYLAKPGCNRALGEAQRSHTLASCSRVLHHLGRNRREADLVLALADRRSILGSNF